MDPYGLPEKHIVTGDGTRIAYWISRPPPATDQGVTLVLANGIGISRHVWQDYHAALKDRFTLIHWDYRSFYRSERPADLTRLALEDHARDLKQILETESIDRAVLVGWSMGVQVSLETWDVARERVAGMVLMNGTSGRTFDTAFGMPGLIYWVPPVTRFLSARYGKAINRGAKWFFRKQTAPMLRATGVVGPTCDMELLGRILDEYGKHDYGVYFHLLNQLGYHRPDHLGQIDTPILILVGSKDAFTPPIAGKRLRDKLPGAELETIDEGTHYMLMEFPAQIRARIEQFVETRVMPREAARKRASSPAPAPAAADAGPAGTKRRRKKGVAASAAEDPTGNPPGSSPSRAHTEKRVRSQELRSIRGLLRRMRHRPE